MALASAIKHDKVILGAFAGAAEFAGLRKLFGQVTSSLTSGSIKSFDDIGKIKGVQQLVQKFTLKEKSAYNSFLVPLGFPRLGIVKGRVTGVVSRRGAKAGMILADETKDIAVESDQFKKKIVKNLKQHIDYLQSESFFQKAHKRAKQMDMIERNEMTREWYHQYALEHGVNYRSQEMLRSGGRRIGDMRLGRMYFFRYKPNVTSETRRTDIYDEFPLLFLLYEDQNNFSGINFHYLSPKLRAILLGRMYMYFNNKDFSNRTKLFARKFREVIETNRKFRHAKVIYRQYRPDQIQSKVIQVHPLDWDLAIMVPTERFKTPGGGRTAAKKIWYQSVKRARSLK